MGIVVTIGVCVRNSEDTLKRALDSVVSQDFPHENMEMIFVDDGSKAQTLSILQGYVSRMGGQVKLFKGNWMGLGHVRNVVVDNAEGDYIVWVDGDMILPNDHVKRQVEFMKQNPKVGIAKARYGLLPDESVVAFLENIVDVVRDIVEEEEWKSNLRLPGTGGAIYRTQAIREVDGFDERLKRVGEDQDAAYRIKKAGWIVCRSHALLYERRNIRMWKTLWDKNYRYGYDHYLLYRKNRHLFVPYRMVPPISFIAGLLDACVAFRLTRRKRVFLLPFQYAFKMTAWFCGFVARQIVFNSQDDYFPGT